MFWVVAEREASGMGRILDWIRPPLTGVSSTNGSTAGSSTNSAGESSMRDPSPESGASRPDQLASGTERTRLPRGAGPSPSSPAAKVLGSPPRGRASGPDFRPGVPPDMLTSPDASALTSPRLRALKDALNDVEDKLHQLSPGYQKLKLLPLSDQILEALKDELCPITLEPASKLREPVAWRANTTVHLAEYKPLVLWVQAKKSDPITRGELTEAHLFRPRATSGVNALFLDAMSGPATSQAVVHAWQAIARQRPIGRGIGQTEFVHMTSRLLRTADIKTCEDIFGSLGPAFGENREAYLKILETAALQFSMSGQYHAVTRLLSQNTQPQEATVLMLIHWLGSLHETGNKAQAAKLARAVAETFPSGAEATAPNDQTCRLAAKIAEALLLDQRPQEAAEFLKKISLKGVAATYRDISYVSQLDFLMDATLFSKAMVAIYPGDPRMVAEDPAKWASMYEIFMSPGELLAQGWANLKDHDNVPAALFEGLMSKVIRSPSPLSLDLIKTLTDMAAHHHSLRDSIWPKSLIMGAIAGVNKVAESAGYIPLARIMATFNLDGIPPALGAHYVASLGHAQEWARAGKVGRHLLSISTPKELGFLNLVHQTINAFRMGNQVDEIDQVLALPGVCDPSGTPLAQNTRELVQTWRGELQSLDLSRKS